MLRFCSIITATAMALLPAICAAGETLLTFSRAGEVSMFDMEALVSMGPVEISTTTIWTDGVQTFTGVPLNTFLAEVNVSDGVLKATAVNDYAVEVPVTDAVADGPIIAYLNNGEPMSVRDKGPLWIVYPFDSNPKYQTEVVYSRSIWQLDRLEAIE